MPDDIVTRLQDTAYETDLCWEAAAEIERLRAAGDALAAGIRTGRWDNTLDAWEDIRRG
jgi:hypothetical protein